VSRKDQHYRVSRSTCCSSICPYEHTDIQEYIGSYVSDLNTGKLVFRDSVLVRALCQGHLVLDELNLAPTDMLESLNRLLTDNRELLILETQGLITLHPNFMLFATQNPLGLYAGRKVLSRAFRNRFIELHFANVLQAELETITHQSCRIAPSYAHRIVSIFTSKSTTSGDECLRASMVSQHFGTRFDGRVAGPLGINNWRKYILLAE
jgi:midasin (ATPase involved in ribosome maturation)